MDCFRLDGNACRAVTTTLTLLLLLAPPAAAQEAPTVASPAARQSTVMPIDRTSHATEAQVGPGAAARQPGKWEIEFHGGGAGGFETSKGTTALPGAGAAFTTLAGRPSRRVSSWFFGDGARLFNELPEGVRQNQVITPLDSAIHVPAARQPGVTVGGRIGRAVTPWVTAEFSLDYTRGVLRIPDDVLERVDTSRASLAAAFNGLIGVGPFVAQTVSSITDVRNDVGSQLLTIGTAIVKLRARGTVVPFVTAGAGVISNIGDMPAVTLTGKYSFAIGGIFPISETDTVTVSYELARREFVGVFGGGITYDVSSRTGLRIDARAHLNRSTLSTRVNASPTVETQAPPFAIASSTTPSLQFSNNSLVTGAQSTFGGPAIADFESFEGGGWVRRVSVTAGWYWRF